MIGRVVFGLVLSLSSYLIYNSVFLPSYQLTPVLPQQDVLDYNSLTKEQLANRLSEVVQFPTISYEEGEETSQQQLLRFHEFLEKEFALVHKFLKRVNQHSVILLNDLQGSD
jgi:hypothetical protein